MSKTAALGFQLFFTQKSIRLRFKRLHVNHLTFKGRLKEQGMIGRIAVRKPLLQPVNKQKRLKFAQERVDWTIDQWKSVLWTDESKFELFGSHRRQYVRRKVNERFKPDYIVSTLKLGGGSGIVWVCFSHAGVGQLKKIEGIMKKEQYHSILHIPCNNIWQKYN